MLTLEEFDSFVSLVTDMRKWQSRFLKTKDKNDLIIARDKEHRVDRFVSKYNDEKLKIKDIVEKPTLDNSKQYNLFEEKESIV